VNGTRRLRPKSRVVTAWQFDRHVSPTIPKRIIHSANRPEACCRRIRRRNSSPRLGDGKMLSAVKTVVVPNGRLPRTRPPRFHLTTDEDGSRRINVKIVRRPQRQKTQWRWNPYRLPASAVDRQINRIGAGSWFQRSPLSTNSGYPPEHTTMIYPADLVLEFSKSRQSWRCSKRFESRRLRERFCRFPGVI